MITIVCAIYKSERYLPAFIKHVQKVGQELTEQNFSFEILFVPTMPSSEERRLLATLAHEPWFRVLETHETGLYVSWNAGVEAAKGDVVGFWNADDIRFTPAIVEAGVMAQAGAEVMYFPFIIKRYISIGTLSVPIARRTIRGESQKFERRKFETSMPCGPHFMFTKAAFKKVGPFDEQFKIAGDFDWCTRAAALGLQFSLGIELSGIFRVDGAGLSAGGSPRLAVENNLVYRRRNAPEKIKPEDAQLAGAYKVAERMYKGIWISV